MSLPRLIDEVNSVRNPGHERFGETESPVAIFIVEDGSDGVSARVGGVVPGAIVVDGPVDELEVRVGAGGVQIEKIRHAELADAEFETATGEILEEREGVARVLDPVAAEGEDVMELGASE